MRHLTLITVVAHLVVGCASGTPASLLRPEPPSAAAALGEPLVCRADGMKVGPLVLDWTSEQRLDLELAMKRGVALVKYGCDELEVLTGCTLPGTYEFAGVTRKEEVVRIESLDELKANLPVGAAQLGGEIQRGSSIDLALVLIGKSSTGWTQPTRSELPEACRSATHLVRAASIGAFSMARGAAGKVRTTAEVFGLGADGGSSSERSTLTKDGDAAACAKASSDAKLPAEQCSATVRLELVPVLTEAKAGSRPKAPVPEPVALVCPPGLVAKGGLCTEPGEGANVCAPDDQADCDTQCQAGDPTSCYHLGLSKIDWSPVGLDGAREQTEAKRLLDGACQKGVSDACFALGQVLIGETQTANIGEKVQAYRRSDELAVTACDAGNGRACAHRAQLRARDGASPNPAAHVPLAQRACALGDGFGCLLLAEAHLAGDGVPRDVAQAYRVLERACEAGDFYACVRSALASFLGKDVQASPTVVGLTRDPARGMRFALRACALEDCRTIGYQLEREDRGVAASYAEAMCKAGHQPSCKGR